MIDETLQPIQIKNWTQGFQTQLRSSTKKTITRLKSIENNTIFQDPSSDLSTKFKTIKISDRCIHSYRKHFNQLYYSMPAEKYHLNKNNKPKPSFNSNYRSITNYYYHMQNTFFLHKVGLYSMVKLENISLDTIKINADKQLRLPKLLHVLLVQGQQKNYSLIISISQISIILFVTIKTMRQNYINIILYIKLIILSVNLNIDRKRFFVPDQAQKIFGTTAGLLKGDSIFLRDLLYGLMLPSGNDAAITLSYNFQLYSLENDHFLKEMNRFVHSIGLSNTQFSNVHGLCNENNFSTAFDVGKFTYESLQNEQFQKIVRTQSYYCETPNQLQNTSRELYWENTNKLLQQGFKGVKTGITKEAGPSVVEFFQDSTNCFIIVLLNCSSSENRWTDAQRLLQWIQKQDTLIKQFI